MALLPLMSSATVIDGINYNLSYKNKKYTATVISNSTEYSGDIVIPEKVTYNSNTYDVVSIGNRAFWYSNKLTSVSIPNGIISIEDDAFAGCKGLSSITIPSSVNSIGTTIFYGCDNLISIRVDNDNPYFDSRDDCNAIIEKSTNTLVVGCKTTIIPNSITSIGREAFNGCKELTSIDILNSVISIESYAFAYCKGLTSFNLSSSVTKIGSGIFFNCEGLASINVDINNPNYDSRDDCNAITLVSR